MMLAVQKRHSKKRDMKYGVIGIKKIWSKLKKSNFVNLKLEKSRGSNGKLSNKTEILENGERAAWLSEDGSKWLTLRPEHRVWCIGPQLAGDCWMYGVYYQENCPFESTGDWFYFNTQLAKMVLATDFKI